MDNINEPVQSSDNSTIPTADASDVIPQINLDKEFDKIWGDMQDDQVAPLMPTDDEDSTDQVSEETTEEVEDEQETSDDGSNIDNDVDGDVEDKSEESTTDSIVDWEEMKQHNFEIDGKSYSANDLKAALGRQKKQDEAHNEVETARTELENERKSIEAQKQSIELYKETNATTQKLAQLENAYTVLAQQRDKFLNDKDSHNLTLVNAQIAQIQQAYNQTKSQADNAKAQMAANAAAQLANFGFGDINTDSQRQKAFVEYANKSVPKNLISVVDTSPELLAMVEKARLYDKSVSDSKTKKKLVGKSTKTLKGSAAKSSPVKKPMNYQSKIDAQIDAMFDDD